jgi:hypothetical protein
MNACRFEDDWLRERLELFKRYTYPSVMSQTDQEFEWVGLIHKDSPEWFISVFDAFSRIKITLVERDIDMGNPNDTNMNLDSDDAIARNFVERAKEEITADKVLYFSRGVRVRTSTGVYINTRASRNHFNVVPAGEHTVLDISHGAWGPGKVVDPGPAMWLEVIHGRNIANRFHKPRKSKNIGYSKVSELFKINPLTPTEFQ